MGWIDLSATGSVANTSGTTESAQYGTHSPTLSDQFTTALNNYINSGSPTTGATATQQPAIDYMTGQVTGGGIAPQVTATNSNLDQYRAGLQNQPYQGYTAIAGQAAPQATASTSNGVPQVAAQTGAADSSPYAALYSQQLIDPSLNAYDYGTDRSMNALNAQTAGAGGFANSRSGSNYGDLAAQSALGRGQLESQLKTTGLTNALGFGQQDATRNLQAQTTNAGNTLSNQQFNAGQTQQNSQFNVNAAQTNTAQQLAALGGQASTILSAAGLSQQALANVVTQNGIDTNAAQSLFAAGAITQSQLDSIVQAAAATNGYSLTQNGSTANNQTTLSASAKGGLG